MQKTGWYLLLSGPLVLALVLFFSLPVTLQLSGLALASVWGIALWFVLFSPKTEIIFGVLSAIGVFVTAQILFGLFPLEVVDRVLLQISIFALVYSFFGSERVQGYQSFWASGVLLLFSFWISNGVVSLV